MGYGDELMGSGMARGAAARGRRVAFGDGRRVIWHRNAVEIFRGNDNVVAPGMLRGQEVEWIAHYPGKRRYCTLVGGKRRRWQFTPHTQRAGEIFFDDYEMSSLQPGFVVVESSVKHTASNKQWPVEHYQQVARALQFAGHHVVQFNNGLSNVPIIQTSNFRMAAAVLSRASLFVGPEGGLHHAAAALGVPAVVLFGGFISPEVTGYESHVNLFTGDDLGCGMLDPCPHCRSAMNKITVDQVVAESLNILNKDWKLRA